MTTIEDITFETIKGAVESAAEDAVLFGAEVHASTEESITKDYGVRVSEANADLAPLRGGQGMGLYDATIIVIVFSRVIGVDKTASAARRAARTKGWELALAIAKVFNDNSRMGGQVLNSRLLRGRSGFDSISNADDYFVVLLPMIVNETGRKILDETISL